ncbi:ketopantoate reductase PanE/ApbA C terminal-domain-containing protein [Tribonema minus]|uniref:Ketopantoate reductase PanE/ApbA C terminal-domain-containing protein n=1 Tax=Tribonema minus TaxID=303371 RepID=A0A836CE13_9STRA|nr:ketopantoate reductase PanE/ApbA C terminal-domain-containing protein [Tribonema minus]
MGGGHDVTFLLRSDYAAAKTHGLALKSADGDMYLPPDSPRLRSTTEGMQPVDWLVLGLKAYALKHARELAGPCYGVHTRVLAITNGLCDDDLALVFGRERTFGAIAYVCVTRAAPAVIHHLHYGDLLIGKLSGARDLWRDSRVGVEVTPCLLRARWEKLLYNIPFSGMSVAMGGVTVDIIAKDPSARAAATRMMEEARAIGNADLAAHGVEGEMPAALLGKMWDYTDRAGAYLPSASVDLLAGRPVELEHLLEVPLARAAALGVPAPTLSEQLELARAAVQARMSKVEAQSRGAGCSSGACVEQA